MNKIKTYDFKKSLENELNIPEFKNAYDFFEEEFTLAKEIIKLRKIHKLTQKQLAEKVGTSQPAIARLESGNYKNLSLVFIRKIANALGTSPVIKLKKIR